MTHYTTTACILLAATAAAAALFIRRAAIYRRRSHRAGTAPQPQPRPDTAQDDGYRRRYVLNRWDGAFRSGKTVRIRPEHYERLRQITARDHRQKPLYDATSKPSDANRCHRFGKRKRGRKSRYICRSKCA